MHRATMRCPMRPQAPMLAILACFRSWRLPDDLRVCQPFDGFSSFRANVVARTRVGWAAQGRITTVYFSGTFAAVTNRGHVDSIALRASRSEPVSCM